MRVRAAMARKAGAIRVGVGGWTFPPWRGAFYPEDLPQRRELEYASRRLSSIEINGTYYGSQKPESFAKWHDETPADFMFAVKGSRFTTNRRVLAEAGESVERFFNSGVLGLRDKLGPVNWQFLPNKKFDPADFEAFLKLLPKRLEGRAIRHAIEVRHASFAVPEFVALARAYEVAVVVAGDSEFPLIADPTAPFVYARIMGTVADEPAGYAAAALEGWAARARAWAAGLAVGGLAVAELATIGPAAKAPAFAAPRDVFLYVISGHKPKNPAAAMAILARLAAG